MFIECVKNNGTKYLRLVDGRTYSINGEEKHKRYVVCNIGPLSRYDDGEPEYLKRLRESFRAGKPIIRILEDYVNHKPIEKKIKIELKVEEEKECFSVPKNIGYFLLDGLYDWLGIYDVLTKYRSKRKLEYDLVGNTRLLTFGRVISPESKLRTFEEREKYLFKVTTSEKVIDIYYTLDSLNELADSIQKRMNHKISQGIGRNTEVCYYDVTNYNFEIGENDADEIDESGKIVRKGLRKKGVSKEKRQEPIVQMGLFIDDNGIPIAYRLFPGSNTDQTTLRPALEKSIDKMKFGKVIIVADGGLNSGPNIAHILDKGNGYIVSKSTKKSDKKVKSWILDENGYEWNQDHTFKVKSQIRTRTIKRDDDDTLMEITEKLVCYWSKKHYEKERHENQKFIEYLDGVIANPDKLKDRPKKIEKFLDKMTVDKTTGEVIKTDTVLSIDMNKVKEYLDLMGFYTIMTSEITKSGDEIISKYHGLSRIEDSFRITKSDLEGRPVFVRTPEHINAHFLTCFISLTMIRLIQYKILKFQGKDTKNSDGWESGLSAERIQNALLNWKADLLSGGVYRTTKPSDDLLLAFSSFGINSDLRLPSVSDLRAFKYSCDNLLFM